MFKNRPSLKVPRTVHSLLGYKFSLYPSRVTARPKASTRNTKIVGKRESSSDLNDKGDETLYRLYHCMIQQYIATPFESSSSTIPAKKHPPNAVKSFQSPETDCTLRAVVRAGTGGRNKVGSGKSAKLGRGVI